MNGEVNGTMEDTLEDTSLPDPQTSQRKLSKDCEPPDDNAIMSSEQGNVVEKDTDHDSQTSYGLKSETAESNNETVSVPIQEKNNSNDSCLESENSSQGVLEDNKQDKTAKNGDIEPVNIDDDESHVVSCGESSDDEDSVLSGEPHAEDAVSINSETSSDDSQDGQKSNDIIIVENDISNSQNGISQDSASPEVHDITSDNDDCVLTNDDKSNSSAPVNPELRRSSRAVKRKHYEDEENDEESDIEEVELEDPLGRKTKPIVISDANDLVEMAAKKTKLNNQKKEPSIVIIDTSSGKSQTTQRKSTTTLSSINAQSLYQSIVGRGTTVTPVSSTSKPTTACQSSPLATQAAQPPILPSLTDDMFVVEAPSFIVPYVYEKPSVKPFREFVDKLGKELEEQKAKEEKERLEKEKAEKEKREQLRKERRERGEDVSQSEDESQIQKQAEEDEKKKKKAEKRAKRRRQNDEDDASWDGESTSDSEDETLSDNETEILKNKEDSIEEIKDVTLLTADKLTNGKTDNYFDCSLGKFFVNIGLNLVQEYVQTDLLKQQNRKLIREKKSGHSTRGTQSAIASLIKNIEFSKENNAPYAFPQTKCELCSFKSESKLVINHHLETPHMKNNMYKCNYCEFEVKSPHDILIHMESVHKVRGRLERAPGLHQCCNCPFEDNGKGKLARHQISCAKKFKPELNLAPPIEWEPPAKIPKIARARNNNMVGSFQNAFTRQVGAPVRNPMMGAVLAGSSSGLFRVRTGRSPAAAAALRSPAPAPTQPLSIARGGFMPRPNLPAPISNNYPTANNTKSKGFNNLSISITPLPRQPQPALSQATSQTKNSFVICEICDGYIKDLEQLRNHMQWIHKVRIHPKMIYNRPPLNCQKCQFRFFTDQGLERHLLGSHGLVTSSMQEAANKGKDAGRCPVCGRVYQWKLLNHVSKDHNLTLKPAHLSYKCTVCTATFGMYKQFENHVYSAHSVVAKRVMDKSKAAPPAPKSTNDTLKPLKINDEITIIPQPAKSASLSKTK